VLETTSVKRRFQEFLNLQNRLEETPVYRSALRGENKKILIIFSHSSFVSLAVKQKTAMPLSNHSLYFPLKKFHSIFKDLN
jgi:hypothetical protein